VVARPDDACPEKPPAGLERSGVVAVVDPASRHATVSVAAVQQAVSTHPVSASGIRLSSRPLSGHPGWSSRGPALGRLLSTRRCPAVRCPPVRCPAVRCLPPSVRTRPSPPMLRRWRWDQVEWPGDRDHRNRCRPRWLPSRRRLDDGPGGRDVGDAAEVALAGGRSVADPGRWVGCGRWRPRLPLSDQAGQAGVRGARRGRRRGGHGSRLQHKVAAPATWRPSPGWVGDHGGWSSPSLTPGWADPEGPGGCRRGWTCGPSAAQAGGERARLAAGSAVSCGDGWWACQDLNLGPHPYQGCALTA
jgi:hypothetical protein